MLALSIVAAVVLGDKVALRASPEKTAAQQATLWKGDWLEVRGERRGWLKVYDHRHERPGWIAQANARVVDLDDASAAPGLRAVTDFLRDAPGSESLGIAYAALTMKLAPAVDAALLVELGAMADRLAARASRSGDAAAAEQVAVAESWGIQFTRVERGDDVRVCFDGAAYRQALAMTALAPADAATAALGLTVPACTPPGLGATELQARDEAALSLLEKVDPTRVKGSVGDRLRVRRAELGARLAWSTARRGDLARAGKLAEAAVSAYARVDRSELADEDQGDYEAAAMEVAAARWAAAPAVAPSKKGPALVARAGEPGETCLSIGGGPAAPVKCTHGQVWASSFRVAPGGAAAVVAVQPLPGWLELWLFRRGADGGWMTDVLTPSTDGPDVGYAELAGWSPDGARAVIVREARASGASHKTYSVIELGALASEKETSTLAGLGAAKRWVAAEWRGRTLALR